MLTFWTNSAKETINLGQKIGKKLKLKDIVFLEGELGTGKTTLASGIAKGLGIQDIIVSPSFVLLREYSGKYPLYHFDFYRLKDLREIEDIGYEEYFYGDGITVIEWPEKLQKNYPDEFLHIKIYIPEKIKEFFDRRIIKIYFFGKRFKNLEKELKNKL